MTETAVDTRAPSEATVRTDNGQPASGRPQPWKPLVERSTWFGMLVACLLIGIALSIVEDAKVATGVFIALGLIVLPLRAPFETALLIVATAWLPLEYLFGREHDIFASLGGLNLSGMRLLGAGAGMALAALAMRHRFAPRSWPKAVQIAVIVYVLALAWVTLTIVWAPDRVDGLRAATKLALPPLVGAVVLANARALDAGELVKRFAMVIGASLIAATLFGAIGGLDRDFLPTDEEGDVANWFGWAGWGIFAFFAGISGCLFLALAEHGFHRASWAGAVLALVQVPLTVVRIAVGAAGVAITAMIAVGGRRRLLAPLGILAAAALMLGFPPLAERNVTVESQSSTSAVGDAFTSSPANLPDFISFSGREVLWEQALGRMEGGDFVLGRGLNAYYTEQSALRESGVEVGVLQMHSEVVRLFYETGPLGLVLFSAAFLALLVGLAQLARRAPVRTVARAMPEAAVGALVFYLVVALTDNVLDYYQIGCVVWAIAAVAMLVSTHKAPPSPSPA